MAIMIRGIDVSANQGVVDWASVAGLGCRFAIMKCSEGNKPAADVSFARNVAGAKAAELAVGAYHFAYPLPANGQAGRDPQSQAQHAFDLSGGLGTHPGELPPALDFEWPPPDEWAKWGCTAAQLRAWALAYLVAAEALWGRKPLLYIYPDFWMHVGGGGEPSFASYPLWMASYPTPPAWPVDGGKPTLPKPWTDWACWQFTGGAMKLPNGTPADFDVMPSEQVLQSLILPDPGVAAVAQADAAIAIGQQVTDGPADPGDTA
jgi:GH25 family lysozyme M1 (1,4-beta-N-acetylmuramidase)